ncbi:DUF255 domain-containing protein [Zavarzinia compransoris]|uniref:Thioredoxin domain-containing protein n=1 Tax=Zavarzinia compransoris TaxID=1264899 RepID=A0A317E5B8_9PROT|nr:DUF255 domain-containing protein [Zavarzinia compransoris]PWR21871.1 hypothetical protein DKG75_07765 [Zavarzinia compransoris]TDP45323.1 hypothetical protein DES42_10523 [Zavarzinia compransoris]
MRPGRHIIAAALLLSLAMPQAVLPVRAAAATTAGAIDWQAWSPAVFARARAEGKLVLLDLQAVWCHWCHVMEATTYADPAVTAILRRDYIAVRVDQDSHPDLSRRYENWGWPATIAFDAEGRELWRYRGYLEPDPFARALEDLKQNPEPLAAAVAFRALAPGAGAGLLPEIAASMERRFAFAYDAGVGGWGTMHKFLQAEALDHVLGPAVAGDAIAGRMLRETLAGALRLVDPVAGGIFQYSVRTWDDPHYEKIAAAQADALRLFALGAAWSGDAALEGAARDIARYVMTTLSDPSGGFFTSQDADPDAARGITGKDYYGLDAAGRAAMPQPRLDRNLYAGETGRIAAGLAALGAALDDAAALDRAARAGDWLLAARRRADGAFAHGARDAGGPYLPDTLQAAQAFEALYAATGERRWLAAAEAAGEALLRHFADPAGGLANADVMIEVAGPVGAPYFHLDDNVAAARLLVRLGHATGRTVFRDAARRLLAFLAHQEAAGLSSFWPGLLTLNREMAAEPLHVVVRGPRADPGTRALFAGARALAMPFKRAELLDPAEGPLPNVAVTLPDLGRPAAFVCTATTCSLPIFDRAELVPTVERLLRPAD